MEENSLKEKIGDMPVKESFLDRAKDILYSMKAKEEEMPEVLIISDEDYKELERFHSTHYPIAPNFEIISVNIMGYNFLVTKACNIDNYNGKSAFATCNKQTPHVFIPGQVYEIQKK